MADGFEYESIPLKPSKMVRVTYRYIGKFKGLPSMAGYVEQCPCGVYCDEAPYPDCRDAEERERLEWNTHRD